MSETELNRPRGILSEADREYLTNPEDRSRQARYKRQDAITERLTAALHDLPLLAAELPDSDVAEPDASMDAWDAALEAVQDMHPSASAGARPEVLREVVASLEEQADRLEDS